MSEKIPEVIYLQWYGLNQRDMHGAKCDAEMLGNRYPDPIERTWCADRQYDTDVMYQRVRKQPRGGAERLIDYADELGVRADRLERRIAELEVHIDMHKAARQELLGRLEARDARIEELEDQLRDMTAACEMWQKKAERLEQMQTNRDRMQEQNHVLDHSPCPKCGAKDWYWQTTDKWTTKVHSDSQAIRSCCGSTHRVAKESIPDWGQTAEEPPLSTRTGLTVIKLIYDPQGGVHGRTIEVTLPYDTLDYVLENVRWFLSMVYMWDVGELELKQVEEEDD